jgi:uncharacterized phage-associated protein
VVDETITTGIGEPPGLRKRRNHVKIAQSIKTGGAMSATTPVTTAEKIASHLIWEAHERGSFISNLKLQKLLYYAQAWHLAIYGQKLFAERFEAWVHGPVIPAIYGTYKKYGWRNIDEEVERPMFDDRTTEFLEELLDEYGPLDALRLEWLTHHEDPWLAARAGIPADQPCHSIIDEGVMESFYRSRSEEHQDA